MKTMRIRGRVAALVLGLIALPSCSFLDVPLLPEGQEVAMGLEAYPEMTSKYEVITRGKDAAMIQRVMKRLIPYANKDVARTFKKPFAWEAKLLDAPKTVNAWALPGGKIAFYSGILPICQGEAGVAVVMSHEIGHAVKRHGNKRISQNMILKAGLSTAAIVFSRDKKNRKRNSEILGLLGVGAKVGVQLPFSRHHESEADRYGLELLVQAGYDPNEAVKLWERMAARGSRGPEFLSTHPNPGNRAAALRAAIPGLLAKYGKR